MSETLPGTGFPRLRKFFEDEEYLQRLERLRAGMRRCNLELLIVSDPANMAWVSGYDGYSFYNHQCVVVPLEGEPVWFARGIDLRSKGDGVHVALSAGWVPEEYVQRNLHPMVYFPNEVIRRHGWENLTVGVEMDSFYFSAATFLTLQQALPTSKWRDATGLVNWQRAVKSEIELEYMRVGGLILDKMYDRLLNIIEPGMKKNELVADIYATAIKGLDGYGGVLSLDRTVGAER